MPIETTAQSEAQATASTEGIERRLAQQALIAEFGRYALRQHGLDAILSEACRIAADGLGTRLAKVLEPLPGENSLLLRAGIGWTAGLVGRARVGADIASPAGYAFKTGEPVISNHLAEEKRFRTPALMADHGVKRAVNVVIRGDGEPFGVLEVDSGDPGAFSPHDVNFLQALANTLGVAIDKERSRAEIERLNAALARALADKDLLAREIDHRVKNSLATISGLLAMQERATAAPEAQAALAQAAARVMTIARIHERLYRSTDVGSVEFDSYLEALCGDLAASLGRREDTRFTVDADRATLPADRAVPLGLIAAELVTNAVKHARHARGRSSIQVTFERRDGRLRFAVADDGPGLPAGFDPAASSGLGMRVVLSLARQLGGTFEAANTNGGARLVVDVPCAEGPQPAGQG